MLILISQSPLSPYLLLVTHAESILVADLRAMITLAVDHAVEFGEGSCDNPNQRIRICHRLQLRGVQTRRGRGGSLLASQLHPAHTASLNA